MILRLKTNEVSEKLVYHKRLLNVIALCASGKNQETKAMCQKLLSIDECIIALLNVAEYSPMLEAAYAQFLDQVYLRAETTPTLQAMLALLPGSDNFWKVLKAFSDSMAEINEDFKRSHARYGPSLR